MCAVKAFRVLRPGGRIAVADILYEAKVRPSFVDREWVSAPLSTLFHLLLIKLTAHVPKANSICCAVPCHAVLSC